MCGDLCTTLMHLHGFFAGFWVGWGLRRRLGGLVGMFGGCDAVGLLGGDKGVFGKGLDTTAGVFFRWVECSFSITILFFLFRCMGGCGVSPGLSLAIAGWD